MAPIPTPRTDSGIQLAPLPISAFGTSMERAPLTDMGYIHSQVRPPPTAPSNRRISTVGRRPFSLARPFVALPLVDAPAITVQCRPGLRSKDLCPVHVDTRGRAQAWDTVGTSQEPDTTATSSVEVMRLTPCRPTGLPRRLRPRDNPGVDGQDGVAGHGTAPPNPGVQRAIRPAYRTRECRVAGRRPTHLLPRRLVPCTWAPRAADRLG